jgi:hypothetical protein
MPAATPKRLLANARYYEAEARKPENAEQSEQLRAMANTSREAAERLALHNVNQEEK